MTYIASDSVFPESEYLWPLYQGASDLYTEKSCIAEVIPDLRDLDGFIRFLKTLPGETEVWRIWQGIEYKPVIRTREIHPQHLTTADLQELLEKDVFHATTTQYEIPVQYRILLIPSD